MEEYERSKRSILKKIRFRLVVLGVLMGVLAVVAFTLGIVRGDADHDFVRALACIIDRHRFFACIAAAAVGSPAQVVRSHHMKIVKFQRTCLGVRLRDLYFVYGAGAIAFGFHGFYVDGNWNRLQLDGNHLVMHVRLYSLLGLATWVLGACVFANAAAETGVVTSPVVSACYQRCGSVLQRSHRSGSSRSRTLRGRARISSTSQRS